MAGNLPKARRVGGPDRTAVIVLAVAAVVLIGALGYLVLSGPLFSDEPASDAERDYQLLVAGLKKNPKDPATLMSLAEVEYELGKKPDAMGHAEKAVKIAKDEPFYRYRYATLLVREDRLKEAESALTAEIGLAQSEAEPFFLLGQIQAKQKRYDEAKESLKQALAVNPNAADVRVIYAGVLEDAGDTAEAKTQYLIALKFIPDDQRAIEGLKRLGVDYEASATVDPHSGSAEGN